VSDDTAVERLVERTAGHHAAGRWASDSSVTFTYNPANYMPWRVAAPFLLASVTGMTLEEAAERALGEAKR
jgi:hypothetical protein